MACRRMREGRPAGPGGTDGTLPLLSICFVFGAAVGLLFSCSMPPALVPDGSLFSGNYVQALWNCCVFHIALIFLAGSVWGSALVPALTAVRAYILTSAAAALAASAQGSVALAWLAVGVPALLTVPCFFVLAADCVTASRRLAAAGGRLASQPPVPLLRHCLLCFPVLAGAAALERFILPLFTARLLA